MEELSSLGDTSIKDLEAAVVVKSKSEKSKAKKSENSEHEQPVLTTEQQDEIIIWLASESKNLSSTTFTRKVYRKTGLTANEVHERIAKLRASGKVRAEAP